MKHFALATAFAIAVAAIVLATYFISMNRQIDVAQRNSSTQLEAYQNDFLSKINNYKHLPFIISRERTILRLLEKRTGHLKPSILLKAIQIRSGAAALFIMNEQGNTIASSNYDEPTSFIGKNYGFRPYFKTAMKGREGSMYAVGATTGIPGYFLSYPITLESKIVAVAVVKLDLTGLQDVWKGSDSIILAKDPTGVITLSNRKDWLYKTLEPLSESQQEAVRKGRLYSGFQITQLNVSTGESLGAKWLEIDGTRYLLSEQWIHGKRWELLALAPWSNMTDTSVRKSLIAGLASLAMVTGILFIQSQRQKQRIERRIEASRRARRIDKEREESLRLLADSIAHQIRNPLIGIGGNANLLKRKLPEDEGIGEHLGTIVHCCKKLEEVVSSVRDYIDLIPTSTYPFDIESLIMESRSAALAQVAPPDGTVNWLMNLEPATLLLDANLMGKALYEILTNALEARASDTITIEIFGEWKKAKDCGDEPMIPSEKYYQLTISDSGGGIDEETYSHMMEPFFSTKPHGTGLGLAKAKRVLQIFHGGISITSPVPGNEQYNTMVQVTLPDLINFGIE